MGSVFIYNSRYMQKERIEIPALRPSTTLELFKEEDVPEIFKLISESKTHLSQHGDETANKYPSEASVLKSIVNPPNPEKLRFAIRNAQKELVGSINLIPNEDGTQGEVGYYLGEQYTGHGYILSAVLALTTHAFSDLGYRSLFAKVHKDNDPSASVLINAGYKEINTMGDEAVYSMENSL